ncbi:unnamed protein product, partial [marine sediment metagenome]
DNYTRVFDLSNPSVALYQTVKYDRGIDVGPTENLVSGVWSWIVDYEAWMILL